MQKPIIAIVGRPNVGKSTFFNRLCGNRRSIVKDTPGVTRDRVFADANWSGYEFTLVDTGGLDIRSSDPMQGFISEQAKLAIDSAEAVIFIVDGLQGLVATDYEIASFLRTQSKPVVLAVNKLDNYSSEQTYEFYALGLGEPFGISSEAGLGVGDLLDEVIKYIPKYQAQAEQKTPDAISIAVVGKPNAGKSSLVNRLLGENRVIVSEVEGTTRDTVDTPLCYDGQDYIIIDTAGIRRKRGIEMYSVESLSVLMAGRAIERADVVFVVLDSTKGMTEQDVKIAAQVFNAGKACIMVMNKWDLIEKDTFTVNRFKKDLDEQLEFMNYYATAFVSSITGQRTFKLLETAKTCYDNARKRVPTGVLNDIIGDAVSKTEPPHVSGKRLKIFYSTQVAIQPPTFALFVNDPLLMKDNYLGYLKNELRSAIDFLGTPIRFELKQN